MVGQWHPFGCEYSKGHNNPPFLLATCTCYKILCVGSYAFELTFPHLKHCHVMQILCLALAPSWFARLFTSLIFFQHSILLYIWTNAVYVLEMCCWHFEPIMIHATLVVDGDSIPDFSPSYNPLDVLYLCRTNENAKDVIATYHNVLMPYFASRGDWCVLCLSCISC